MVRPWVEFDKAVRTVRRFLRDHATALAHISETASRVFEAIVIVRLAEAYEQLGFAVSVVGRSGNTFRFKFSTRGNPSRYSRFLLSKNGSEFVLCHNLSVKGKHAADVIFSVDAGVAKLPDFNKCLEAKGILENVGLVTFAECKHLVAYPMLVAQFLGVVHEILPDYLNPAFRAPTDHPYPILFVSGNASKNVGNLLVSFKNRGYRFTVLPNSQILAEADIRSQLRNVDWIAY